MLSNFLKENTQKQHQLLEDKFNSNRIFEKSYSVDDYKRLIGLNYQFLLNYEKAIHEALSDDLKDKLDISSRLKLPIIIKDAENLGLHQNTTENTKEITSEAEALGMLYVIEGASLGGNVIKKQLQKNPDFSNVEFNYFGMYGEQIGTFWKNFTSTINTYFSEEQNKSFFFKIFSSIFEIIENKRNKIILAKTTTKSRKSLCQ